MSFKINSKKIRTKNCLIATFPWLLGALDLYTLLRWLIACRKEGLKAPPHQYIKRLAILREKTRIKARIFVETGTYTGGTIWFLRKNFEKLYSIELEPTLAKLAQERFSKHNHIEIICGDSAEQLQAVSSQVNSTVLFWLDGHYSGGITASENPCPVWEELECIRQIKEKYSIMIDDARLFGTDPDYPTIDSIKEYAQKKFPDHLFKVEYDIIHLQCKI